MKNQLIKDIEEFLKNLDKEILSEIHLEVLLAMHLKQKGFYDEVYPEYTFHKNELGDEYIWGKPNDKISVDLVVLKGDEYIPIELKYKTKRQELDLSLFGSDKNIVLAKQGGQSISRYDFWKDVKRLEVIKRKFEAVEAGIVLFVTNYDGYKNEPEKGSQYAPFSIHNNRNVTGKEKELDWSGTGVSAKTKDKFPAFQISNDYELKWIDLELKTPKLHYLLLTI